MLWCYTNISEKPFLLATMAAIEAPQIKIEDV